ncbi:MAG TPA: hypothetical protein VFV65_05270 [Gemmatimonadales bacterium]|nr:hypothetical protein [Gemmatimonadales bacterium]
MSAAVTLPELGPALGRLVHPAAPEGIDALLAPVRLSLVTRLLGAAGEARAALDAGSNSAARAALAPAAWAAMWDAATEEAAAAVIGQLDQRITAAAVTARMPEWRVERHRVTPEEHRAIHARLGASAGAMLRAAAELEHASGPAWSAQVLATARRMESAWSGLSAAATWELAEWEADIAAIAAWRRARWPLWTATAVVYGVALWAGLMLGGYLRIPAALRPVAELLWRHL